MTTPMDRGELTGRYSLDPTHSRIGFVARHAMVTKVRGAFNEFSGTAHLDGDAPERSSVQVTIQAASIDTRNADRDGHLRSNDFLQMDEYPEITFRSTGLRQRSGDRWDLEGELTLCGQTRPVVLDTRFLGVGPDPWGGTRASASATTQLRREDFAMNYNQALKTGIAAIGTTLKVEIDIQAVRED